MFGFIYSIKDAIVDSVSKPSSSPNRYSQQNSAIAELAADTVADITPGVLIPTKVYQSVLSLKSIFSGNTHYHEKMIHGCQAALCTLQIGISMYLFLYDNESCEDSVNFLCRSLFLTQKLYRGLMLTGLLSSVAPLPAEPAVHPKSL